MTIRSTFLGTGHYLPEKVLTNADLEKMVDTSDEWIVKRSGIKTRHIAADDETTADMAIAAAREALSASGLSASDIDGVIVATTTPDQTFPSVAVKVQAALGISTCPAFDVQAVCTGFVYALGVADNFIKAGQCKNMIVIVEDAMAANNITAHDVDFLVPHQANIRILQATAKKLNMPLEKVILTVDHHGNTSAASVPLALHEGVANGQIKKGDLLLFEALGGGLTWGAALARF